MSYEEIYARSMEDPEGFWGDAAADIDWYRPWDKVLDDSNKPFYRWFAGGELNTCYNAVDRHVENGRADQLALIRQERGRLAERLARLPGVRRVWPSDANFLLLEAAEPRRLAEAARAGGVLIRDFSDSEWTPGCLRITVGLPAENDQLLAALEAADA